MKSTDTDLIQTFPFKAYLSDRANKAALSACGHAMCQCYPRPLYVYGRSGSGKTLLLYAKGNESQALNPDMRIGYISAEDYCASVVNAYRKKSFENFRSSFRALDLLLFDDVQLLKDKPKSQEELVSLIDALVRDEKRIVICGDVPAEALEGLSERLVSRLSSGATVHIAPPGPVSLGSEDRAGESVISSDDIAKAAKRVEHIFAGERRNTDRIPVLLETIRRVWVQEGSDLRLGQLLVNLSVEHGRSNDLFYVEDDELMEWLLDKESKLIPLRPSGRQVFVQIEMSGTPVEKNRLVEIAMLEAIEGRITRTYHACIDPEMAISEGAAYCHGLTTDFAKGLPKFADIAAEITAFIRNAEVVVWNERFVVEAINQELVTLGFPKLADLASSVVVVCKESRCRWPSEENDMDLVSHRLGVPLVEEPHHGLVKAIQLFRNYQALLALPEIED